MNYKSIFNSIDLHFATNETKNFLTSFNRYLKAISLVSILYAINIILGLGRDSILAATFGATEQLDALLLGLNFVRTVGLQIALAIAGPLIPIFIPLIMANDKFSVVRLSRRWLWTSLLIFVPVSLLLVVFSGPLANLLGPGLDESGLLALKGVLIGIAPLLIILGCAGLSKAILDSYGLFGTYPMLLGSMTLGLIIGVTLGGKLWGVQSAIYGLIMGSGIGLIAQVFILERWSPLRHDWRSIIYPKLQDSRDSLVSGQLNLPVRNVVLLLGSYLLVSFQGMIERAYVSQLPEGSVVALSLALSVLGVPSALLLPALSSVLLPSLARHEHKISQNTKKRKYGLSVQEYLILILIFVVITGVFWIASDVIVKILFWRGKFTLEAVLLTSTAMRWLSLSFIGYMLSTVLGQVFIARGMIFHDLAISFIILISKIVLLEILLPHFGLLGLSLEIIFTSFLKSVLYFGVIRYAQR